MPARVTHAGNTFGVAPRARAGQRARDAAGLPQRGARRGALVGFQPCRCRNEFQREAQPRRESGT